MGVDNFIIKLDTPNAVFIPGSIVSGVVLLTVSGEERTHAIRIKLNGIAQTEDSHMDMLFWIFLVLMISEMFNERQDRSNNDDGEHDQNQPHCSNNHCGCTCYHHHCNNHLHTDMLLYGPHNHRYSSSMKLIDSSKLLLGDDINTIEIPEGDHSFPFSFQLPALPLPPSCRINARCYVSYELQASIAKPWYMRNVRTEVTSLKVLPPLDLNHTPWARMPMEVTDQKNFGLLWWASEPLIVRARVDPSGFCLGHRIPVEIEIDNRSDRELTDVRVELIQVWTLSAWDYWGFWNSTWEESQVVSTIRRNERVPIASVARWVARLLVPSIELPTLISVCQIIKMGYKLKVTACVDSTLSWNLSVDVPVTIGSAPFSSQSQSESEGGGKMIELQLSPSS